MAKLRGRRTEEDLAQELMDIAARCSRLPDLDRRTADEILGYDQNGAVG